MTKAGPIMMLLRRAGKLANDRRFSQTFIPPSPANKRDDHTHAHTPWSSTTVFLELILNIVQFSAVPDFVDTQ